MSGRRRKSWSINMNTNYIIIVTDQVSGGQFSIFKDIIGIHLIAAPPPPPLNSSSLIYEGLASSCVRNRN